jgi:hypothetical protein
MSFRGVLLKPGEKNGTPKQARPRGSVSSQSRYEVLKEKIRTWLDDRLKIGDALREIREGKLYKNEYSTFEEFCDQEYGLKHSQAYRLIEAVEIKESLNSSPVGDKIQNERQARALKPVPVEQRAQVVEKAAEKGPVTARAITEAAIEVAAPKPEPLAKKAEEKKPQYLDKTGYQIPDAILSDWQRAEAFGSNLREISRIKSALKKGLDESDLIFGEVTNTTVSTLSNAYGDLKRILPYAVCPTCQGRTPKKCTTCRSRGFVSEFFYNTCIPEETKKIRERAIKK